jgi:hypothetical protein
MTNDEVTLDAFLAWVHTQDALEADPVASVARQALDHLAAEFLAAREREVPRQPRVERPRLTLIYGTAPAGGSSDSPAVVESAIRRHPSGKSPARHHAVPDRSRESVPRIP